MTDVLKAPHHIKRMPIAKSDAEKLAEVALALCEILPERSRPWIYKDKMWTLEFLAARVKEREEGLRKAPYNG